MAQRGGVDDGPIGARDAGIHHADLDFPVLLAGFQYTYIHTYFHIYIQTNYIRINPAFNPAAPPGCEGRSTRLQRNREMLGGKST
ncbi:MAG: hypothetical protein JWR35_3694 [Marmoricola sp.]|nr:hypothetical protein [Marmoricola sp.]